MGESQSRYSIIADLTNQKLRILDDILNLDNAIEIKKQIVINKTKEFVEWEKNVQEDIKKETKKQERHLKSLGDELTFEESQKDKKESTMNKKIVEIDAALKRLEEISKLAGEKQ